LATPATNPDLREITACPAFIDPKLASTWSLPTVDKSVPIDVSDMPFPASTNEPNRYDVTFFVFASSKSLAMDE